jgi:hypothetical protein
LLVRLWQDYAVLAPQCAGIFDDLAAINGTLIPDHVAIRTLSCMPFDLDWLVHLLEGYGFVAYERYWFEYEHLCAVAMAHPSASVPRFFVSALEVAELGTSARQVLECLADQVAPERYRAEDVLLSGRCWAMPGWEQYQAIAAESHYAAWFAAFGYRVNHYAVPIHELIRTPSLDEVIERVQRLGCVMNETGGLIKGNALVGLQQSATVPEPVWVEFPGGQLQRIAGCHCELVLRYPQASGQLYEGFIADSARKTLESTYRLMAG